MTPVEAALARLTLATVAIDRAAADMLQANVDNISARASYLPQALDELRTARNEAATRLQGVLVDDA